MMKRVAIIIVTIAFLALAVFLILGDQNVSGNLQPQRQIQTQPSASPTAARSPTDAPVVNRNDQVIAACKLVPISYVNLSFNTPGLVAEVLVSEGDKVEKGQLLAHLSNQEAAQAAIASANLDLINAQQSLKVLYDNAPLKAAEALLAVAKAPEIVKEAESKVSGLETRYYNQADVDAAKANLIFAQKKLETAQEAYQPYSNKNENSLMKAKLLSELSQAQNEFNAALRKYNSYFAAPSETTVSKAEADLAFARIQEEDAQRRYEILKNGPDPDEVALAEARIANSEAQLAAAQSTLANMELRAPFSGTVAMLDLKPGAYVSPGADVLLLVDDSDWRVETTDLSELSVVQVHEGDLATIAFDALPSVKFDGEVLKISSLGENRQGDITYRVETNLQGDDERLKWNMTCSITIKT